MVDGFDFRYLSKSNVYERRHSGMLRTNNAIESYHNGLRSGLAQCNHPQVCKFVEVLKKKHALVYADIAKIYAGETRKESKDQTERNNRLETLVQDYLGTYENDVTARWKLCRGVSYNYW